MKGQQRGGLPPRWIHRLLGLSVPASMRSEILHELDLRYSEIARTDGRRAAARWYRGQLVRSIAGIVGGALGESRDRARDKVLLNGFVHDVRFACRAFVRRPSLTITAVTTLALGIGANTAIFSVVDSVLLRPLPYPEPDQLVSVYSQFSDGDGSIAGLMSYPNYVDARDSGVFQELVVYMGWRPTLIGPDHARRLYGTRVSEGLFSQVLQVSPQLGRTFSPEEDTGDSRVVILSHELWLSEFSGDSSAIGASLLLDENSYTVVGVMPADFRPRFTQDVDLWTPLGLDVGSAPARQVAFFSVIGRLDESVSLTEASSRMKELSARLRTDYPESNRGVTIELAGLHSDLVKEARTGLWLLLGAVVTVLLIASVNVANLMLANAAARRSEMALRLAIGAGTARIFRQRLTEGALLALAGGLLGVLLGTFGVDMLVGIAPASTPFIDRVALDIRVLAFVGISTATAAIFFGSIPAFNVTRGDLNGHLRSGRAVDADRRGQRTGRLLVTGQIGLSLILLIGTSLMVQTVLSLESVDTGFDPDSRIAFNYFLSPERYGMVGTREFPTRLEERLQQIPGVTSAGSVSALPLAGDDRDAVFNVEGYPIPDGGEPRTVWYRIATANYFDAMGIRVVAGRGFDSVDDSESHPTVLINEEMASRYFGDRDPIGARMNMGDPESPSWMEIIGVVENVKGFGVRAGSRYVVYIPHHRIPLQEMAVVLHTSRRDPAGLIPEIRSAMADLDPTIAVADIQILSQVLEDTLQGDRFTTMLLSLFSVLSLALSVIGLYGLVNHAVERRKREMGIRIAVGASSGEIRSLVVESITQLVVVGVALGIVGSLIGSRFIESILFGVSAIDWMSFAGAVGLMTAASIGAAMIPAMRASKVDPVVVLKAD